MWVRQVADCDCALLRCVHDEEVSVLTHGKQSSGGSGVRSAAGGRAEQHCGFGGNRRRFEWRGWAVAGVGAAVLVVMLSSGAGAGGAVVGAKANGTQCAQHVVVGAKCPAKSSVQKHHQRLEAAVARRQSRAAGRAAIVVGRHLAAQARIESRAAARAAKHVAAGAARAERRSAARARGVVSKHRVGAGGNS
jgi:hypothetical protein